jgi:hypothetical protein
MNSNITCEIIESTFNKRWTDWDYHGIMYNPNVTYKFLVNHKKNNYIYYCDIVNQATDIDIIKKTLYIDWNWASTVGLFFVIFLYNL